jgi:hypothetical protein
VKDKARVNGKEFRNAGLHVTKWREEQFANCLILVDFGVTNAGKLACALRYGRRFLHGPSVDAESRYGGATHNPARCLSVVRYAARPFLPPLLSNIGAAEKFNAISNYLLPE